MPGRQNLHPRDLKHHSLNARHIPAVGQIYDAEVRLLKELNLSLQGLCINCPQRCVPFYSKAAANSRTTCLSTLSDLPVPPLSSRILTAVASSRSRRTKATSAPVRRVFLLCGSTLFSSRSPHGRSGCVFSAIVAPPAADRPRPGARPGPLPTPCGARCAGGRPAVGCGVTLVPVRRWTAPGVTAAARTAVGPDGRVTRPCGGVTGTCGTPRCVGWWRGDLPDALRVGRC